MSLTIGGGITIGSGVIITPNPPGLVTAGLLYNYDAATYSGSGNWIDSVQGGEAVPTRSPAWSDGAFTLDSTNSEYFTAPWPAFQPTYTIDVWFTMDGNQNSEAGLICDSFQGGSMNFVICAGTGVNHLNCGWFTTNWAYGQDSLPAGYNINGTTWYNLTMAVSATGVIDYINGAVSNDTQNPFNGVSVFPPNGSGPDHQFWIGKSWSNRYYNGKIAVVNMYDRALTGAEVAQNFNYYRSRFGL